jgi:hypothetical protein
MSLKVPADPHEYCTVHFVDMLVQRSDLIAVLLTVTGSNLRRHLAITELYVSWRRYLSANATCYFVRSSFVCSSVVCSSVLNWSSKSGRSIDI